MTTLTSRNIKVGGITMTDLSYRQSFLSVFLLTLYRFTITSTTVGNSASTPLSKFFIRAVYLTPGIFHFAAPTGRTQRKKTPTSGLALYFSRVNQ